jgi:ATP-binding cassette subfamily B protein
VFLDGVDIREIPLATLRAAIGFVPQEPFLFSDTIAENIGFGLAAGGDAGAVGERMRIAAGIARLDKDVEGFPKGYETLVGERGITLSGGQKQRTALARAVMLDPRILILDDAFASVDVAKEAEILSGLRRAMGSRTVILITHRLRVARLADRVVVLDEGRVVEEGRHLDLLGRGGVYARLWRVQQLEDELARA